MRNGENRAICKDPLDDAHNGLFRLPVNTCSDFIKKQYAASTAVHLADSSPDHSNGETEQLSRALVKFTIPRGF